jgi:hypothetical protein
MVQNWHWEATYLFLLLSSEEIPNMKKLVLGALLAVAASTGCTVSESTEAVITARWSFTNFATDSARSCPVGFDTATIVAQAWDPFSNELVGSPVLDKFDCADMQGTTLPLDGIFLVWVQIESASGTQVYAQSSHTYVDTIDGDVLIDFEIFDDAGFFFLTWDLVDAVTQAPLTCDEAGVTGNASVETIATIVGSTFMLTDKFQCEHGYGTTSPLLAGTYTVSVDAEVNDVAVGVAPALTNRVVRAPNGLTDLGHILIPIE